MARILQESLTSDAVGQVRAFSPSSLSTFKALTIPKQLESEVSRFNGLTERVAVLTCSSAIEHQFAYTSKPASVVRNVTVQAKKLVDQSKAGPSADARYIICESIPSDQSRRSTNVDRFECLSA